MELSRRDAFREFREYFSKSDLIPLINSHEYRDPFFFNRTHFKTGLLNNLTYILEYIDIGLTTKSSPVRPFAKTTPHRTSLLSRSTTQPSQETTSTISHLPLSDVITSSSSLRMPTHMVGHNTNPPISNSLPSPSSTHFSNSLNQPSNPTMQNQYPLHFSLIHTYIENLHTYL